LISFKRQALLSIHKRRKMLIIRPWLHVKWFLEDTFQHPLVQKKFFFTRKEKRFQDVASKFAFSWGSSFGT